MEKLIIIKYAELSTKKENIGFFLNMLKNNINYILKDIPHKLEYDQGRMFIYSENLDEVLTKLKYIFGIHEYFVGYKISNDLNDIKDNILEFLRVEEFNTFKVETKRSYKEYPLTSPVIDDELGGFILKHFKDKKVDIHKPDLKIYVEIRKDYALLYFHKEKGLGGYPVATSGKGLLMLSGGIDSPVAGYMAMKRGVKIEAIYFESPPHTSTSAKEKVISLSKILSDYNGGLKLHVINFTEIQEAIYKNIPHEYLITIMRRMMYRIAELVAYKENSVILINGESIGQVASQTLTSIEAINTVIKKPVIRPLACLDKLEIIEISKRIGTYETSILPFEDCCTIFVPKHPVISPEIKLCETYEKLISYQSMINKCIKEMETIKIDNLKNEFNDIL